MKYFTSADDLNKSTFEIDWNVPNGKEMNWPNKKEINKKRTANFCI